MVGKGQQQNLVDFELLKSGLRYLSEIFTICSSYVCANLMEKFLSLLNRPARNGPFLPKFWTALATVFVGIFFRKKFWWGFRPISVAYQKEFWISWKKQRFQIFQKPSSPGFQSFLDNLKILLLQCYASREYSQYLLKWNLFVYKSHNWIYRLRPTILDPCLSRLYIVYAWLQLQNKWLVDYIRIDFSLFFATWRY